MIFYFDLGSPYAYLSAERIIRERPEADWQPVLLGGLFKTFYRRSWATTDDREDGMKKVESRAARYGLPPVRWPDPWPGDGLTAMRIATFAKQQGCGEEFALQAFRMAFVDGNDLGDPAVLARLVETAGLNGYDEDPNRWGAAKEALRSATAEAATNGVFGVPTFRVGNLNVWGDDRLEEAYAPA